VIYELRMRLPYVYAATERLWPTMNPGFAPPPAVFAAMPVSSQALLGSGDDDEDIKGYCTEFVRIGEESDDVDEVHTGHNNHYYLSVRREIDCNV
jgi:hypothetical protein